MNKTHFVDAFQEKSFSGSNLFTLLKVRKDWGIKTVNVYYLLLSHYVKQKRGNLCYLVFIYSWLDSMFTSYCKNPETCLSPAFCFIFVKPFRQKVSTEIPNQIRIKPAAKVNCPGVEHRHEHLLICTYCKLLHVLHRKITNSIIKICESGLQISIHPSGCLCFL